ncbi:FG-GAP repeat domain-containing protein [Mumia sp. Pv 4-285]|uniref:FG-GAP repeat domain-containing protein n=1 Tax=Mumia qirimensis TaxID=3234852 RepID=UPI00351D09F4
MSQKSLTRTGVLATALVVGLSGTHAAEASATPRDGRDKVRHHKKAEPTWNADRLLERGTNKKAPRTPSAAAGENTARSLAASALPPDVTGDGRADLVAQMSAADAGAIRIYDTTGSTTSNPWEETYRTTATRWEFADLAVLADVTGDAKDDLIVRDPGADGGTLWIYPNNGDPADPWTTRVHAGTGWNLADTIRVGDVTGDGSADLLVRDPSNSGGTLWVYRGNGSTTSNPWTQSPIWSGTGWNLANALMLGDATGDGNPDIVARDGSGNILVYPHNGATTSNFWTSIVTGVTGFGLGDRLELADVTADGRPDIIARTESGTLRVHPSLGTTPGSMWSPSTSFPAGSGFTYATGILVGDVDGDGRPELAARLGTGQSLFVLPNNGSTSGNPWTTLRAAGTEWGFASRILVDDVNGDGRQDLLVLDRAAANGTLWIYLHNGAATGNPWPSRYFAGTGWNIFDMILAGDVTGDGKSDLVGRQPGGDLYAYPGNGSTTSFPWDPRVWVGSNWQQASQLALHDFDDDGYADLVDLENDGSLWVFPTATGDPITIDGDWSGVTSLDVAHVDGTGHPDLVVRDSSGSVWIHPGNGATASNPWTAPRRFGGNGFESAISFGM